MVRNLYHIIYLCVVAVLSSCVTESEFSNTPRGNLDALWQIVDEHYCFFPDKAAEYGLDWDECHRRYSEMLVPSMRGEQLFEVCGKMLGELRDGHVNLASSFNTARYWDWFENYPVNFSDSLQRVYIGTDYRLTCGIRYCIFPDNIGYIYVPSFEGSVGNGNLDAIFYYLRLCDGLIVDVRNNEGGLITMAQDLASGFVNEKTTVGYIAHKTGAGHNSFSTPEAVKIIPSDGMRWQKPVALLTNRRTYSAANAFVMYMKDLPNVTIIGDRTGGGAGMPYNNELPNGWTVRFSACPTYDIHMQSTENGIDPHLRVDMQASDFAKGEDTIIETARQALKSSAKQSK
ncbi:MAG: S41 family peptidase [Bacteroidaceae bacterium]|nr:S41 family peptidase [Bacteroidaceae bacterium]